MSDPTQELLIVYIDFAYGALTLYGRPFQGRSSIYVVIECQGPTTPYPKAWFGLFPVRSPLLGESLI